MLYFTFQYNVDPLLTVGLFLAVSTCSFLTFFDTVCSLEGGVTLVFEAVLVEAFAARQTKLFYINCNFVLLYCVKALTNTCVCVVL